MISDLPSCLGYDAILIVDMKCKDIINKTLDSEGYANILLNTSETPICLPWASSEDNLRQRTTVCLQLHQGPV